MIDLNILTKGAKYEALKKSYIIFICTFDYFNNGCSIYTFQNLCSEDSILPLGDESYKIFLNTTIIKDDVSADLKDFLNYVAGREPKGTFANKIADAVNKLKEHKETNVGYMPYRPEIERQRDAAAKESRLQEKLDTAIKMFKDWLNIDKIVKYTELPIDQVRTTGLQGGYISA